MTDEDHERLIDVLMSVEGKVLLSGYHHPIYEKLGWKSHSVDTVAYTSPVEQSTSRNERQECLWRNYEMQPTLFDVTGG